jgi:hypothetical protein
MARSRYRSVTYHLEASVNLARMVEQAGGHTDMEALASVLSYSGVRNGAFLTRLANARLFGLVAGRSGQVTLLDRGRRCLSPDPAEAREARVEACLAVPLFRHVLERLSGEVLPPPEALAGLLEQEFGEAPARALATAKALIDSAGQAGLIAEGRVKIPGLTRSDANFTDLRKDPGPGVTPPVGFTRGSFIHRVGGRRRRRAAYGGQAMADHGAEGGAYEPDQDGLWLDEGTTDGRPKKTARRAWLALGTAACLVVIGIPVGLLVTGGSGPGSPHHTPHKTAAVHLGDGPAKQSVLAALSATTDAGNFDFTYVLSEAPGTKTTTTTTTSPVCPDLGVANGEPAGAASSGGIQGGGECGVAVAPQDAQDTTTQGSGIINTNPMAMAASADISQGGSGGLSVGVRVDPTTVWEVGDTDNGLTPQNTDEIGQPLPGFAGLTEGTLGSREGAVAMMGMASPTGYLDLVQPAISGAAEVGSSTVGGVSVTQYELAIDPTALASAPGVTSAEASTITSAVAVLTAQGFTTIRDLVSVDASGFIRESSSTVAFSDGGTVTLDAQFSDFGCAGTLLMPGQGGTSTAPAGCTSPDTGVAPATTTTTTAVAPTTSTVVSPGVTPTTTPTTTPPSTTTPSTTSTTSSTTTSSTTTTTSTTTGSGG